MFYPSFLSVAQEHRELQSVCHTLSLLLLPQREVSSHCSPAPVWGSSHWRQSFGGSLMGVFPKGFSSSQTVPVWVHSMCYSPQELTFLMQLLTPRGRREPATMWASKRVTASFMHPPAPEWRPPHPPPFRGTAASAWSSPQVAGESLSSTWRTSCPSLFVWRGVSLKYSHFFLWFYCCFAAAICPFLNLLSQRCHHCH